MVRLDDAAGVEDGVGLILLLRGVLGSGVWTSL